MHKYILAMSFASVLCGCAQEEKNTQHTEEDKTTQIVEAVQEEKPLNKEPILTNEKAYTGTIVYKDLEGGFYAFEGDDGSRFTLSGMDASYRKHGLYVEITGKPITDVMTITQFGTEFKLSSIKVIDSSKVTSTNPDS